MPETDYANIDVRNKSGASMFNTTATRMTSHTVTAKCVDKAFDSKNAMQYYPNDMVNIITKEADRVSAQDINLADPNQRKLVWLKTLGGRWVFQFDRANSSNTTLRIFFCKECGQPFDRFTDLGTHSNSLHNKTKAHVSKTQAANADEEEEEAIAAKLAAEAATEAKVAVTAKQAAAQVANEPKVDDSLLDTAGDDEQTIMLKDAIAAQQGDKEMAGR